MESTNELLNLQVLRETNINFLLTISYLIMKEKGYESYHNDHL